ncbi:putative aspartic peptidase domain-containing protein [Rosa chinensis]|uniref:Putative aspartic peptidase domain-containing protein n=1 Tax=Rosa chinensis TaxID=74649 RepID=A0A2P6PNU8_ROSCH|nr:putative aspartic peptidase domain-containing protein [Rosa chinensis]
MVEGAATNNGKQDDYGDEGDEEVDYGEEEEQGDYDNENGLDYDIGDDTAFDIETLSPFYKGEAAFGKGEGNTMDINMVYVLPSELKAQPGQSNELIGDFVADRQPRFEIDEVDAQLKDEEGRVVLTKPTAKMAQHLKPLYITAYIEGYPITKVLVDNGAAVNVLPTAVMKKLRRTESDLLPSDITVSNFSGGKSRPRGILPLDVTVGEKTNMTAFFVVDSSAHYNALLGRDWIHQNMCVPSSLHQVLIFWHGDKIEVIPADNNPFQASTNVVEARFYEDDIGYFTFSGGDSKGRPTQVTAQKIVNLGSEDVLQDAERPTLVDLFKDNINV